ncbi:MAG: FAD-binding oxidoreductase, partial [Planctomycetota bacterium]|nr:FAD-binding oxidoreductase [Planctomycetota bacterium]
VATLGERGALASPGDRARYERGWRYGRGVARCIARPSSTAEVAATLRVCAEHGARVVAQGANTGLVAASTPDAGGDMVVLSLERLCDNIELDVEDRTVVVDGGVLLSQLNDRLAAHGLWFPVDLGADPQIGGMVATNTGGTRLLKYGDVRRNLLGLEVVLGDGRVLSQLNRLRKNNTGLDSKQLFVGTTGVFGVVTKAVLAVAPRPKQTASALVACRDGRAALALLGALERGLGDVLSAFEVIGAASFEAVLRHHPEASNPFERVPPYAALVEVATTLSADVVEVASALESSLAGYVDSASADVLDVVVDERERFWRLRHSISECLGREGPMVAFDVSVARSRLPEFTDRVRALLRVRFRAVRRCASGHWGDGGSHLNLLWRERDVEDAAALTRALQDEVYALAVGEFGGSFSAEHGVGPHNQRFYDQYTDVLVKELSQTLGAFCDPDDLLGTTRLG